MTLYYYYVLCTCFNWKRVLLACLLYSYFKCVNIYLDSAVHLAKRIGGVGQLQKSYYVLISEHAAQETFFGDSQTRLRTKQDLEPNYISRLSFLQRRRVARAHFCYTDSTVRICSIGHMVRAQERNEINLYGF